MARGSKLGATVGICLKSIGVDQTALSRCSNIEEEFSLIKKDYFKKILATHPDKGGDPVVFRDVQGSFEVLRELFDSNKVQTFSSSSNQAKPTKVVYTTKMADFEDLPTPSWEYYQAASEEPVPAYRVELAKSARSACMAKGAAKKCNDSSNSNVGRAAAIPQALSGVDDDSAAEQALLTGKPKAFIAKGELRVGWMDMDTGAYGGWTHLACWRVPSKRNGLQDPASCTDASKFEAALLAMNLVLLCSLSELPKGERAAFVRHVMNKKNHAKEYKFKSKQDTAGKQVEGGTGSSSEAKGKGEGTVPVDGNSEHQEGALVPLGYKAPEAFVIPVPGKGTARPNCLAGQTVVFTGVFPEVGGGTGLSLGKDRVKAMVESFGGRVTGSVSGKTTLLLVGKEPGFSKVSQARRSSSCQLLGLHDLKGVLEGGLSLEDAANKPVAITSFSAGYRGNGLAADAPPALLAAVSGIAAPMIRPTVYRSPTKAAAESPAGPKAQPKGKAKTGPKANPKKKAKAKAKAVPKPKAKTKRKPKAKTESFCLGHDRMSLGAELLVEAKVVACSVNLVVRDSCILVFKEPDAFSGHVSGRQECSLNELGQGVKDNHKRLVVLLAGYPSWSNNSGQSSVLIITIKACSGQNGVLTACCRFMSGGNVELRIDADEEASWR
eukprot:gene27026-2253_t